MPFKDKARAKEHFRLRYLKQKEMAYQGATIFLRDVKKSFKRGTSVDDTAEELLDEFREVYNSSIVDSEVAKLQTELVPNEPSDEIEEMFSTLTRSERSVERAKLIQKLEFLEILDTNDDVQANRFINDVRIAMDVKVKGQEMEDAKKKSFLRLGKPLGKASTETSPDTDETGDKETVPASLSLWKSFFTGGGAGGGEERSSANFKRSRSR
jgi:hypothetical protein